MAEIKITYGIDDGYAGGNRPHYLTVYTEDLEGLNEEEIRSAVWEMIEEDMKEHIHSYWSESELPEIVKAASEED